MRILHTADWHLGRLFYGTHLTEDQAYVLENQFYKVLQEESIDAILISGDVYDRAVPPVEAVELWDSVISKLGLDLKIPTIVISGNHDNGVRLEMGRRLLEQSKIYLRGHVNHGLEPILLEDSYGPVAFAPIPFGEEQEGYIEVALEKSKDYERKIALSHAFVAGGVESSSERPLLVGGAGAIHPQVFQGFNYTALGHLHRPQRAGHEMIRYSGSLLPYSFDEVSAKTYGHDKSFTIVDMDKSGNCTLSYVPIESKRQLVIIEGFFEDLMKDETIHKKYANDYVLVRLLDGVPIIDGMARLRKVFPMAVALELVGRISEGRESFHETPFYKMNEEDLFKQFIHYVRQSPLTEEEDMLMKKVWHEARKELL